MTFYDLIGYIDLTARRDPMAKKQTRRSVSIRGTTYDRVRTYCDHQGLSMSQFMEARIDQFLSGQFLGEPVSSEQFSGGSASVAVDVSRNEKRPVKQTRSYRPESNSSGSARPLNSRQLHDAAREFTF